jgi:malate synthase
MANVEIRGATDIVGAALLSPEALEFVADLDREFEPRRRALLERRGDFRQKLRSGVAPSFLPETQTVRTSAWKVAPPPTDLVDRRVEITGPVDRKMIINALNSGAKVFMADFEDAHSPTWSGTVDGQQNLFEAVRRTIRFVNPEGRSYQLDPNPAVLMVRPRGWHLVERHVVVNGQPISASLFDFGVFFFHNAVELVRRGTGPYFYLPKLEHYEEARLWNDVFLSAQRALGLPPGTVRATVLIETLPAAFQMHEILWELRDHSAGLNCGRWDYIFSFIKQYADDRTLLFPDRAALPMTTPFLDAYVRLLIATCHRRGAHAMGGMAAQIPIKDNPERNREAIARVAADKEREVSLGHDGTWVAHPGLVPVALAVFDRKMPGSNQIERALSEPDPEPADLLRRPTGSITDDGLRRNARVSLRYLESWLRGTGCVPIDYLMEDAATVEIARSQVWQWVHHGARLDTGLPVDFAAFERHLARESAALETELSDPAAPQRVKRARQLLSGIIADPKFTEFLTLRAYEELSG